MIKTAYILLLVLILFSCSKRSSENIGSVAKYTYGVQSWETLGSQTLVLLDAGNPSSMDQDIKLTVEVFNSEGKKFTKDTTIHFNKEDRTKDFQLLIDTEGEVAKVKVSAQVI